MSLLTIQTKKSHGERSVKSKCLSCCSLSQHNLIYMEKFAVIEYYSGSLEGLYPTLFEALEAIDELQSEGGDYRVFKLLESTEIRN